MVEPKSEKCRARALEIIKKAQAPSGALSTARDATGNQSILTRDFCLAALGILADDDAKKNGRMILESLKVIQQHQTPLGQIPSKVDLLPEHTLGEGGLSIDTGLWFTIAVFAASEVLGHLAVAELIPSALRALRWSCHLDLNMDGVLETPEGSDWADLMPHRNQVLVPNVLYRQALLFGAQLARLIDDEQEAETLAHGGLSLGVKLNHLFWLEGMETGESVGDRLRTLSEMNPNWGVNGQYATRYGEFPFYLSYLARGAVGRHLDTVGNCLAIITGLAPKERAQDILAYFDHVGVADPYPSKACDPPITAGDPDYRDYFHWRNLNLPSQYQNGGIWPFVGSLHVLALVKAGQMDRAKTTLRALSEICLDDHAPFPEWLHGQTGKAMGKLNQIKSAGALLIASKAVETGRVPFFGALHAA